MLYYSHTETFLLRLLYCCYSYCVILCALWEDYLLTYLLTYLLPLVP